MCLFLLLLFLQEPPPQPAVEPKEASARKPEPEPKETDTSQRTRINLAGQTNSSAGESRRNENVQFNLIDTNTVRDLNVRVGATASVVAEFRADASYFGTEYGNRPLPALHPPPASKPGAPHGNAWYSHNNSIFSARSFFQVGDVQPARENDYGFQLGSKLSRFGAIALDGRQQKLHGQVNGNVLVPLPGERTPLTTDLEGRRIVQRFLAAYPRQLPNRTDIDPRALNTNAPQAININSTGVRYDLPLRQKSYLGILYQFTSQQVDAFQLVAGQNPDTDTHAHNARISYRRTISASTTAALTAGFDRITTSIRPEPGAVGPSVSIANFIATLGPSPPIPIIRAVNRYRHAAQLQQLRGQHNWYAGAEVIRHQTNGRDQDTERGVFQFSNDFGRDAITNLRLGAASSYVQSLGNTWRGYRHWGLQFYAGDRWRLTPDFSIDYGLRYEPVTTPYEVHQFDVVPYPCDCNNVAPRFGFGWRLPMHFGRIRGAYGVQYGEIFSTTFSQVRMSPPSNYRIAVGQPSLTDPLGGITIDKLPPGFRSGYFYVSPHLVSPYSHQYNFSWEPDFAGNWKLQLAYVGSRSWKLFQMWFENRAHPVPGIPQTSGTINQRRPDPTRLEVFRLEGSSRGYYDAARVTLLTPRQHRFSGEVSYWFSKAMDLGNDYTATLSGADARQGRSQSEFFVHQDLKGLSLFDQKHAFLMRGAYDLPLLAAARGALRSVFGGWTISAVGLVKNGTPFSVESGSDSPGFGNVDGQGSDRVHLLNPAVLGRTIGNPDTSLGLLPRSAFAFIQPTEDRGNLGRNTFRRGKIANVNASLARTWRFSSERSAEFRAESINFFNTPQFAEPSKEVSSPSFAKITNTLNDGRTFRFLVRFRF
ncbi:MAG: hypothetical protein HY235_08900 [Acidobacteria bacterium]|nr:hypothetical protein [Acidobacteriota bacterium]